MKYFSALSAASLIALVPVPLAAAPSDGAKSSESSKRICRVQGETGRRFKRRVCATNCEWKQLDEIAEEARKNVDKIQRRACDDRTGC